MKSRRLSCPLTLMDEAAPQWSYTLRDVSDGLRYLLRTGGPWRMLLTDPAIVACRLPPDAALADSRGGCADVA